MEYQWKKKCSRLIPLKQPVKSAGDGINWALSREMVDLWAKYLHVFRMKHVKCFCTLVLQFTTLKSRFFLFATWTTNITNRWEIPQFQDCKYTCIVFLRFFPIILCTTNDEPIFHFHLFVIATHLLTKVTRNFLCASDARDEMKFDGNNRKKNRFSFVFSRTVRICFVQIDMKWFSGLVSHKNRKPSKNGRNYWIQIEFSRSYNCQICPNIKAVETVWLRKKNLLTSEKKETIKFLIRDYFDFMIQGQLSNEPKQFQMK